MSFINVILFGAPGSGKGTQATILSKNLNLFHLSTGDLLREVKNDQSSAFFYQINEKISKGELVSDDILFQIVSQKINTILENGKFNGIIYDGFPRNSSQADFLSTQLKRFNSNPYVFNLEISHDIVVDRIINRFTCSNCKEVYNRVSKNPKMLDTCDICLAKNSFSDRSDDTPGIIHNRLKIFDKNMSELLNFYKKDIISIDASLPAMEISNILKKRLENPKNI